MNTIQRYLPQRWWQVLIAASCGLIFCIILVLLIRLDASGEPYWSFWASSYFGVPTQVAESLLVPPLFSKDPGWDGQFYYHIATDPFCLNDTKQFIDHAPYRYQRIGASLISHCLARLFSGFQDGYVAPGLYLAVLVSCVLLGLLFGSELVRRRGGSFLPLVTWLFSIGTLATTLHGLPDGAADGLMLLAAYFYHRRSQVLFALAASLAVLSREALVLFPCGVIFYHVILCSWTEKDRQNFWSSFWRRVRPQAYLFAPLVMVLLWKLYVHFHVDQLSVPFDLLIGLPFVNLIKTFRVERFIKLAYPLTFTCTLLAGFYFSLTQLRRSPWAMGVLLYSGLCTAFGPVVMEYYRDGLKNITPILIGLYLIQLEDGPDPDKGLRIKLKLQLFSLMALIPLFGLFVYLKRADRTFIPRFSKHVRWLPLSEIPNWSVESLKDTTFTALKQGRSCHDRRIKLTIEDAKALFAGLEQSQMTKIASRELTGFLHPYPAQVPGEYMKGLFTPLMHTNLAVDHAVYISNQETGCLGVSPFTCLLNRGRILKCFGHDR